MRSSASVPSNLTGTRIATGRVLYDHQEKSLRSGYFGMDARRRLQKGPVPDLVRITLLCMPHRLVVGFQMGCATVQDSSQVQLLLQYSRARNGEKSPTAPCMEICRRPFDSRDWLAHGVKLVKAPPLDAWTSLCCCMIVWRALSTASTASRTWPSGPDEARNGKLASHYCRNSEMIGQMMRRYTKRQLATVA